MSHLLSMLNPKPNRYDTGAGGVPKYSASDVAAALAMVNDPVERHMLCLVWAPGLASAQRGDEALLVEAVAEWNQRATVVQHAEHAVLHWTARNNILERKSAEASVAKAKAQSWPLPKGDRYRNVIRAAMQEFTMPRHCNACQGRGETRPAHNKPVRECPECNGSGRVSDSIRARAVASGFSHHEPFRLRWVGVYDWSLQRAARAYHSGYDCFIRNLKGRQEQEQEQE